MNPFRVAWILALFVATPSWAWEVTVDVSKTKNEYFEVKPGPYPVKIESVKGEKKPVATLMLMPLQVDQWELVKDLSVKLKVKGKEPVPVLVELTGPETKVRLDAINLRGKVKSGHVTVR